MQNLLNELTELLSKDKRLTIDGKLLKNKVIELALGMDADLIKLLLKNKNSKKYFFTDVEGVLVFDKIKFQHFVSNKEFLPDSYTAFKNKIGLINDNGDFISDSQDVVLAWPYKDCVLEGGQTKADQKRDEIFWNETLAPDEIDRLLAAKILTKFKRHDKTGKHTFDGKQRIDFSKENVIIKGNNLLALHSLYKRFAGQVKLIFLDPPYNTGKDSFKYNDSFNHSAWLTFVKNRVQIAKGLLAPDGILIVQSDDKEQAYLKVLLDDIFHREQFETSFYVQVRYQNKTLSEDNDFQKVMEVAHVYSMSHNNFAPNKIRQEYLVDNFCWKITETGQCKSITVGGKKVDIFKDGDYEIQQVKPHINGLKETWATGSLIRQGGTAAEFLSKYLIERKAKDGLKVLYKVYGMGEDGIGYRYIVGPRKEEAFRGKFYSGIPTAIKDAVTAKTHFKEMPIPNLIYNYLSFEGDFGNCRQEGMVDIEGGKKPEQLLKYFLDYFTKEDDIVLDCFLGSGTTAAVAHKMHRQYLGVEQLDYGKNDSVTRLSTVIDGDTTGISKEIAWKGGGSFISCELMNWNEAFISRIRKAKDTKYLLDIWEEMQAKAFLSYKVDPKTINDAISDFKDLSIAEQKKFLIEALDKNQLYVNYSEIDDKDYKVPEVDKKLNNMFYGEV